MSVTNNERNKNEGASVRIHVQTYVHTYVHTHTWFVTRTEQPHNSARFLRDAALKRKGEESVHEDDKEKKEKEIDN